MKLLFFGAGASFGSEVVTPYPPPLGANLFEGLASWHPALWRNLPPDIQALLAGDFEVGTGSLWKAHSHAIAVMLRSMSKYFSMFYPGTGNTYLNLIRVLEADGQLDRTVFSTLNYECLLEHAIHMMTGHAIAYRMRERGSNSCLVLKLHGSCNWVTQVVSMDPSSVSIGPEVTIEPGFFR